MSPCWHASRMRANMHVTLKGCWDGSLPCRLLYRSALHDSETMEAISAPVQAISLAVTARLSRVHRHEARSKMSYPAHVHDVFNKS